MHKYRVIINIIFVHFKIPVSFKFKISIGGRGDQDGEHM